jgi:hypothetical protein
MADYEEIISSTFNISSMGNSHPKLSELLKNNLKDKVFEAYKDNPYKLEEAEGLINDLERLGCKEIEKKLNEKPADQFDSTVSELKVAKILLDNKHKVEFLSEKDSCFKKGKKKTYQSPDIVCKDKDSTTCVEVVRLNVNLDIMELIQKEIEYLVEFLPYRVDVYLRSEKLSMPGIIESENPKNPCKLNRREQEDLALASLETFKQSCDKIKEEGVLPDSIPIHTNNIDFQLTKVNSEQGFFGFSMSTPSDVPPELIRYLDQHCIDGKNKAKKFPSQMSKNPFIIAIDLNIWLIDEEDVNTFLYGLVDLNPEWMKTIWEIVITEIHTRDSWKKIEKAQRNGWDYFLRDKFLVPNNETLNCINKDKEGKFVSDNMEDVSGVLLIGHNNKCFFYPNPFCRDEN